MKDSEPRWTFAGEEKRTVSRLKGPLEVLGSLKEEREIWIKGAFPGRNGTAVEFHSSSSSLIKHRTFLSCFHAGHKVVALVLAVVLIRVVQRDAHPLELVPFVPNIASSDGVLDALLLGPQAATSTPA